VRSRRGTGEGCAPGAWHAGLRVRGESLRQRDALVQLRRGALREVFGELLELRARFWLSRLRIAGLARERDAGIVRAEAALELGEIRRRQEPGLDEVVADASAAARLRAQDRLLLQG